MSIKVNTSEVLEEVLGKVTEVATANGLDLATEDFTIIQPLEDGNAIMVSVEDSEDGSRKFDVQVRDTIFVLEPMEGTLDVFVEAEDEE